MRATSQATPAARLIAVSAVVSDLAPAYPLDTQAAAEEIRAACRDSARFFRRVSGGVRGVVVTCDVRKCEHRVAWIDDRETRAFESEGKLAVSAEIFKLVGSQALAGGDLIVVATGKVDEAHPTAFHRRYSGPDYVHLNGGDFFDAFTLAHELGHALGLFHSGQLVRDGHRWRVIEYANYLSVMGSRRIGFETPPHNASSYSTTVDGRRCRYDSAFRPWPAPGCDSLVDELEKDHYSPLPDEVDLPAVAKRQLGWIADSHVASVTHERDARYVALCSHGGVDTAVSPPPDPCDAWLLLLPDLDASWTLTLAHEPTHGAALTAVRRNVTGYQVYDAIMDLTPGTPDLRDGGLPHGRSLRVACTSRTGRPLVTTLTLGNTGWTSTGLAFSSVYVTVEAERVPVPLFSTLWTKGVQTVVQMPSQQSRPHPDHAKDILSEHGPLLACTAAIVLVLAVVLAVFARFRRQQITDEDPKDPDQASDSPEELGVSASAEVRPFDMDPSVDWASPRGSPPRRALSPSDLSLDDRPA